MQLKIEQAKIVAICDQIHAGVELLGLTAKKLAAWEGIGRTILAALTSHTEDCVTELGCTIRDVDDQCDGQFIWQLKQILRED